MLPFTSTSKFFVAQSNPPISTASNFVLYTRLEEDLAGALLEDDFDVPEELEDFPEELEDFPEELFAEELLKEELEASLGTR